MSSSRLLMVDLLAAVYWYDEALQAGLKARGWNTLNRTQSMIFTNMAAGVQRPSQLAKNIGVSRQAVSQALAEMEAAGLLDIKPDPTDGRAQLVTFSEASVPIRHAAVTILSIIDAALASRIGARNVQVLRDALSGDWGPSPGEIVAAASGMPFAAPKPRGRPPGSGRRARAVGTAG